MTPTLWRKTWRDLKASWAQSVALMVIVAIGVVSLVALTGAYRDLGTSYRHTYDTLHFADLTIRVAQSPANVAEKIANIPGVQAVTARLVVDTGYLLPDGTPIRARLIGIPAQAMPAVNQVHLLEGRYLSADDPDGVLVESHFAELYHLHPGDTVTPIVLGQKQNFIVRGVAASPEYLVVSPSRHDILPSARSFGVFFLPLKTLQRLTHADGKVNEFCLLLSPKAQRESVLSQAEALLQPYQIETATWQKDQPSNAALHLDLEGYREMGVSIPALILLVAALSLYVMLGRMVRAQRAQVGLMKALGYSGGQITAHYVVLALFIGGGGALLGDIVGVPFASAITKTYASELGIPLVQTRVYIDLLATGLVVSLIMAGLASWMPARSSARLQPAQAMRLNPAEAVSHVRRSIFEHLLPGNLPLVVRLPLRNVFRSRGRALSTWISIVFAFVLVLFSWGMLDSMNYMLDTHFQQVEQWDIMVVFSQPQTTAIAKQAKALEGVHEAIAGVMFPARLKADGKFKDVLVNALPPKQNMHRWHIEGQMTPTKALADNGILITPALAKALGVHIGDTLQLETPLGQKQVVVRAFTDELYGSNVFISTATVQRWAPPALPLFNVLYVRADANRSAALKKTFFHLPGAASVQVKQEEAHDWRSFMGLFYLFMGFIIAFAVSMAFAVLFNAMTVSILERRREMATMRALGASVRRIGSMFALESLILWLLALVPGMALGWYTATLLVNSFTTDLFVLQSHIALHSYIITAVGILITMLLASYPAIRRIARLNLADATRMLT